MKEIRRIEVQFHRSYEGDAWHGPALKPLLQDLHAREASARPLKSAHTIWEIALHIITWHHTVYYRMHGEEIVPTPAEDWPRVADKGQIAWRKTLDALQQSYRQMKTAIGNFKESQLEDMVPGNEYTFYFMLHGLVQHNTYHAGQIAILKQQIRSSG